MCEHPGNSERKNSLSPLRRTCRGPRTLARHLMKSGWRGSSCSAPKNSLAYVYTSPCPSCTAHWGGWVTSNFIGKLFTSHLFFLILSRSLWRVLAQWFEQYVIMPSGKCRQKIALVDESLSVMISLMLKPAAFTFPNISSNMSPSVAPLVPSQLCPGPLFVR